MSDLPIQFVLQQISDRGASTPCVARTTLQTAELCQGLGVSDARREQLIEIGMRVMQHLIACLEIVERVRRQIEKGRKELEEKGLRRQSGGRFAQLPRVVNLQKEAENFLYNAKLSLRDTGGLMGVFHGQDFEHRYDKALKWAEENLGRESRVESVADAVPERGELRAHEVVVVIEETCRYDTAYDLK